MLEIEYRKDHISTIKDISNIYWNTLILYFIVGMMRWYYVLFFILYNPIPLFLFARYNIYSVVSVHGTERIIISKDSNIEGHLIILTDNIYLNK